MMKNRRHILLGAVSILALSLMLKPANAWVHGAIPASFSGNPNVTISAINTSGGIVCSRTSATLPAFIQVSASAITATGTSIPYEDLEFSWNFGDPTGTESILNPVTGANVNPNTNQIGPEAAYVYRTAGTKTITLTIKGKNGSGYTTSTVTQDVTISAYNSSNGTFYFDSNAGGTNSGTQANPYTDLTQFSTKANLGSVTLLLAQGSNFIRTTAMSIIGNTSAGTPNSFRIMDYVGAGGAGARPKITCNAGVSNQAVISMLSTSGNTDYHFSDIVWRGIDLIQTGGVNNGSGAFTFAQQQASPSLVLGTIGYMYFDSMRFETNMNTHDPVACPGAIDTVLGPDAFIGSGFWNCIADSMATEVRFAHFQQAATKWGFWIGCQAVGAAVSTGANASFAHHFNPEVTQSHGLIRYCSMDGACGGTAVNANIGGHDKNITLAWAAGVATATCSAVHNWPIGSVFNLRVASAFPVGYNGIQSITATTTTQFTYSLVLDPGGASSSGRANTSWLGQYHFFADNYVAGGGAATSGGFDMANYANNIYSGMAQYVVWQGNKIDMTGFASSGISPVSVISCTLRQNLTYNGTGGSPVGIPQGLWDIITISQYNNKSYRAGGTAAVINRTLNNPRGTFNGASISGFVLTCTGLSESFGAPAPGDTISGGTVIAGTKIVDLLTGDGGPLASTYLVDTSQIVAGPIVISYSCPTNWTKPIIITDNIIQDERASPNGLSITLGSGATLLPAGTIIDRNSYFKTGGAAGTTNMFNEASSSPGNKTLTQWQTDTIALYPPDGFDKNSSFLSSAPWVNPGGGNFAPL